MENHLRVEYELNFKDYCIFNMMHSFYSPGVYFSCFITTGICIYSMIKDNFLLSVAIFPFMYVAVWVLQFLLVLILSFWIVKKKPY